MQKSEFRVPEFGETVARAACTPAGPRRAYRQGFGFRKNQGSVSGFGETRVHLYRRTLLIRNSVPLGTYSSTMPRVIGLPLGDGRCLMSEVPL